jgi:DnaJ-class molecular chaperone
VRINILPSKMFQRDGMDVRSTLSLKATEAEEGGPFEVETLRGMDMVFLSADVKDGDTHTCAARRSVSLRAAGKKPVPPKLIALRCG